MLGIDKLGATSWALGLVSAAVEGAIEGRAIRRNALSKEVSRLLEANISSMRRDLSLRSRELLRDAEASFLADDITLEEFNAIRKGLKELNG